VPSPVTLDGGESGFGQHNHTATRLEAGVTAEGESDPFAPRQTRKPGFLPLGPVARAPDTV